MNEQMSKENLMLYPYERKCLSLPDSSLRYYLNGYAICQTSIGYCFFGLAEEKKQLFVYGQFYNIQQMQDGMSLSKAVREQITVMEVLDEQLAAFGMASVSFVQAEDAYILFFTPQEVYVTVCTEDIACISTYTTDWIQRQTPNNLAQSYMIYLENNGRVIE